VRCSPPGHGSYGGVAVEATALAHRQSWHFVWPIALAALADRGHALWRIGILSFVALLGVYICGYLWVWEMPRG